MRLRLSFLRRLAPLSVALAFGLSGCADTIVPALEAVPGQQQGTDGARRKNDTCYVSVMYQVDGDQFTLGSSGRQTIDPKGRGMSRACARPGEPPRAGIGLCEELEGYDGFAQLLWDGEVVDEFTIDKAFMTGGRVEVLSYDAGEDGHYEYHLYTRPDCGDPWPTSRVLTREQVEAMER